MSNEDIDWDKFLRETGPRLYSYFCARVGPVQADDLTQETLVRLVRKVYARKFDFRLGTLRMFAFGIAHFVALEATQSTPRKSHDSEDLAEISSEEVSTELRLIEAQESARIRKCIQALPDTQKQILCLMIDEEMSLNDIAIIVSMPLGTVKNHIHRAKLKIIAMVKGGENL